MTKTRDLADLGGGFIQAGTGAVQRTVESKLQDMVSVKDFGAVGDGVADDTAAIQAAVNNLITITNTRPATLVFPAGDYKITAPIDFSAVGGERMEIVGGSGTFESATIKVGYHGYGTSAVDRGAFYFSSNTSSYSRQFSVSGFLFERITASFRTPPAIEIIGGAQSRLNNITVGSWSNVNYRFDVPQNMRCINLTTFSGGYSFPTKDASGITVTQSGTTLTASGAIFSATDVNKTIGIWGTGSSTYRRKAKITAYTSPTEVTVEQSVTDATPRRLLFGSPGASLTSGSTTVTSDFACFTAEQVGLYVWFRYPSGGFLFRSKIASFVSSTEVTLADTAPATNTKVEFGVAGLEIFSSGTVSGDSSDNKFINLQIENHKGIGVVASDASILEFVPAKIHSEQSATDTNYSIAAQWLRQVDGFYTGSFDAQYLGAYKLWVTEQTAVFNFPDLSSRSAYYEQLIGIGPKNSNYDGASVVFDNLAVFGAIATESIEDIIDDQNTQTPGYQITGSFSNQGDPTDYLLRCHLGRNIYADDNSSAPTLFINAGSKQYSLKSHGGAGFDRFTVRDETASADRLYIYSSGAVGPAAGTQDLGLTSTRWNVGYIDTLTTGTGTTKWTSGAGSPEGVLTAAVGSLYTRTDGGAGTTLYVKESGTGNTGWVAK